MAIYYNSPKKVTVYVVLDSTACHGPLHLNQQVEEHNLVCLHQFIGAPSQKEEVRTRLCGCITACYITPPPPICISHALVQAAVGVGTVIILYVI